MSDFFFNCPRCGTSYCCDDSDRKNLFQCPKCSHFFTPEKTNGKICPSCGKSIPEAAVKCRHCGKILDASVKKSFSASRGPDFRKNLVGFLLLAVLLAAGIFGWREYSVRKAAKEAARREALEQDRLLAEKRRREEAARREAALQREREAEVKRRIAEEARRREAEAKRRAAEEAARRQRDAEKKARREAEAAARQQREAEEKARREAEEARQRAQREENEALERKRQAAQKAEQEKIARENEIKLRRLKSHLQTLEGQLKIKNGDLERALKREKNSNEICKRKRASGRHKYPCTCNNPTWEEYQTTKASCCKAYIAAVLQREKLEEEIGSLNTQIGETLAEINQIGGSDQE